MTFDNFTRCDFCDRMRGCRQFLFDGRDICGGCYETHVKECPTCNDIVIDGAEGQQCASCSAFCPLAAQEEIQERAL
jgi:hypothetical protein